MRTSQIKEFAVPVDHRVKLKENEKRDKFLDLARELKKLWNMKVTVILMIIGALGTVTKGLIQGQVDLEMKRTRGDSPNYCIIKINKNTEESPGDFKRLAITQTPVRNHRLTLLRKT